MKNVRFLNSEGGVYVFVDEGGDNYYLDVDDINLKGVNKNFFDSFYFCKKIKVLFREKDGRKLITEVVSFK
ncbi:hypothetical protein [Aeromonas media]|uniref:hypothetical protein n=1 Tax=Aeromonas media TaxID=651 RepID=UPI00111847CA|nr:hypothetical protein [Aeromonas media]TNI65301.1 hypothetical protein CF122_21760 [Aeromonas media]